MPAERSEDDQGQGQSGQANTPLEGGNLIMDRPSEWQMVLIKGPSGLSVCLSLSKHAFSAGQSVVMHILMHRVAKMASEKNAYGPPIK